MKFPVIIAWQLSHPGSHRQTLACVLHSIYRWPIFRFWTIQADYHCRIYFQILEVRSSNRRTSRIVPAPTNSVDRNNSKTNYSIPEPLYTRLSGDDKPLKNGLHNLYPEFEGLNLLLIKQRGPSPKKNSSSSLLCASNGSVSIWFTTESIDALQISLGILSDIEILWKEREFSPWCSQNALRNQIAILNEFHFAKRMLLDQKLLVQYSPQLHLVVASRYNVLSSEL